MIQRYIVPVVMALLVLQACGNSGNSGSEDSKSGGAVEKAAESESGLTDFELEHGIGPVTERIELGEIDPEMEEEGRTIFATKSEACHTLESRLVGPALGEVTERRSGAFVMNFIMNHCGMTRVASVGQEFLWQYFS